MLKDFGIGIDIVNISRFENKPFNNNTTFYKNLFLDSEIKYCLKFSSPYEHFAGKFAIKESVIKSIQEKISFLEIETDYLNEKPIVKLLKKDNYNFLISLSHEDRFAIAVVISEKKKVL